MLFAFAGPAFADHVTAVDAEPEAQSVPFGTNTADIQVAATWTGGTDHTGDNDLIKYRVTSGPNQSAGLNAEDSCPHDAGNEFTCTVNRNGATGTDTILVWADNNGNNQQDGGEPFDEVTVTWLGAPAAGNMSIEPTSDSAAVGTCNAFTVTFRDQNNNPIEGETIWFTQTHSDTNATVDWCTPTSGPNPSATTTGGTPQTGTHQKTGSADTATDENGQVTIGITSDMPGTTSLRAFFDSNSSSSFDAGEPTATATKTWTGGGADSVTQLTASPGSATNPTNTDHTVTVVARNAQGDPVPGVTVNMVRESGPGTPASDSDTTDNNGEVEFETTSNTAGTDNYRYWVNTSAGGTAGPDAGEPQTTATKTWQEPPAGAQITVTCTGDPDHPNADDDECYNPTSSNTSVFTAMVTDGAGNPLQGVRVNWQFFINSATPPATLAPQSCTTDASGQCTTTVTNPSPDDGEWVNVTGRIAGTGTFDRAYKEWQDPAPSVLDAEPESDVNQTGTDHTVVATVMTQFGDPVSGHTVAFSVTGRNNQAPQNRTTNAAGQASFTYTDGGNLATAGTDNIFVDAGFDDVTVQKRWIPEPPVAASVAIDMENCDGNLNDHDAASWNDTANSNEVGTTHEVCASALTAGGEVLRGHEISFTSSGVGVFVDQNGDSLGTSTSATIGADGYARVTIYSEQTGNQTVTASKDGHSDSGVKPWHAADSRFIDCSPQTATNPSGTQHVITCLVTDRYGNPVPGESVVFTETGTGRFDSSISCDPLVVGPDTCVRITNSQGVAEVIVSTTSNETGTQTITAEIFPGECDQAANNPPGAAAGVCVVSVTKVWTDQPIPPEGGFPRSVTLTSSHNVIRHGNAMQLTGTVDSEEPSVCSPAGVTVTLQQDILGQPGGFQTIATLTTDSNGQFSHAMSADYNSSFVASVAQEGDCAQASSDPRNVLVRARVSLNRRPKTVNRGGSVRFRAQVLPCDADMQGTRLTLQRAVNGVFGTVARKRVNNNCAAIWHRTQNRSNAWRAIWGKQREDLQRGGSVQRITTVRRR